MAWPGQAAEDYLSGEPAGSESGVTFRQALWDRDVAVAGRSTYWHMVATTHTATDLTTVLAKRVRIPAWCMTDDVITLKIQGKHSAGGVTGTYRLDETDTTTAGTSDTLALTTALQSLSIVLTVPDDTWAGTLKTLDLLASVPSGTGTIDTRFVVLNLTFGAT